MKRHRLDLVSLFFGLSFVAIGGVFISGEIDVTDVDWAVTWPLPIIAGGLMMLAAALRGMTTSRAESAAPVTDGTTVPPTDVIEARATTDVIEPPPGDDVEATGTEEQEEPGAPEPTDEPQGSAGQGRPPLP